MNTKKYLKGKSSLKPLSRLSQSFLISLDNNYTKQYNYNNDFFMQNYHLAFEVKFSLEVAPFRLTSLKIIHKNDLKTTLKRYILKRF